MRNGKLRIMLAHHRGPYKQSFVVATALLLILFLFFPPFEFTPYKLKAEIFEVVEVPDDIEIPEKPEEPTPPPIPIPEPDPGGDDDTIPPTTYRDIDSFPIPPAPGPDRDEPFFIVDELPVPEYIAQPVYPRLAREAGIEGTVMLKALIGLDHKVKQAVVLSSDVTPAMERAAIEAAMKCRYKPAKQGSIEVEVWVPILINFRLND